jgi:WD40 repeat protein
MERIASYQTDDQVVGLSWSLDCSRCACLSASGLLSVVPIDSGVPTLTVTTDPAGGLTLDWGKRGILTGGQSGFVHCWNPVDGLEELFQIDAGRGWVQQARWTTDNSRFVTATGKTLRLWSQDGELIQGVEEQPSTIAAVSLRPDNRAVGLGIYGGVRLYRFGEQSPYEDLSWKGSIIHSAWSPNARFIAASSQERTINFWRLPFRPGKQLTMSGYATKVRELAWDSTSRYLASGGSELITIWDVSGKGPAGTKPIRLKFHKDRLTTLEFQPNGARLASGAKDGRLAVWDSVRASKPDFFADFGSPVSFLKWSPCGKQLAVGTGDGSVELLTTSEKLQHAMTRG